MRRKQLFSWVAAEERGKEDTRERRDSPVGELGVAAPDHDRHATAGSARASRLACAAMLPFRLVRKNLFKHKLRAILTIASLAVAIFLLCLLRSLVTALDAGVRSAAANRVIVQSSVSLYVYMPESYTQKLATIDGVEKVCPGNWFGGYYQEPKNFFAQFAFDMHAFLDIYPEIEIIEGSREDLFKDRQACIIGDDLAQKFDTKFKVGDTFPVTATFFPRADGRAYEFKIAGIYHTKKQTFDNSTLFFHYDLLQKALETGDVTGPKGVAWFTMSIKPGYDPIKVMEAADAMFENGPQRIQCTSEREWQQQFVSMMGNVPFFVNSIGTGVMIAILLAAVNTMLMAAREQTRDIGVLKALGFTDASVFGAMLSQALFLCGLGGALGIAVAKLTEGWFISKLGNMFPGYAVTSSTLLLAVVLTLAIGLFAGIAPALTARRLKVIDALRTTA
jgi:putative ABC transport system permease protein